MRHFSFPLALLPLALLTCDGDSQKLQDLLDRALSSIVTGHDSPDKAQINVFDVIAMVHSIGVAPDTFWDLVRKLLHDISSQFTSI